MINDIQPDDTGGKKNERIAWHPAFFGALHLELEDYLDVISLEAEHQLSSEPLIIDVIIVKKRPGVIIDKNIGRIFRERNIIEYKSPEDYLTIGDFHKGLAYSHLYISQERVDAGEVTMTYVSGRKPRKVLEYIEKGYRLKVEEEESGIYRVEGYKIPIQILESGKLEGEENVWIRGLRGGLSVEGLEAVLEKSEGRLKEPYMGAYLYAVLEANAEKLKEMREMKDGWTLERYVEEAGLAAKWRKQGMEKGIVQGMERGIVQVARTMLKKRLPLEVIAEITGLTAEQLKRLERDDALYSRVE